MCKCSLCGDSSIQNFLEIKDKAWGPRRYWRCSNCQLTFLDSQYHLSFENERMRYNMHENDINDSNYIKFLSQLANPLMDCLNSKDRGLDFGCGPTPAMNHIFQKKGYHVDSYDPHFFSDQSLLEKKYDFIICSETAEHFYNPCKEFKLFNDLLKPQGFLGVMTSFLSDNIDFESWHYRHDPTHVSFYKKETLQWISSYFDWKLMNLDKNIAIFCKN